jgi:hypothetical protein
VAPALIGVLLSPSAAQACSNPRRMDGFKTCASMERAFEEGALVNYAPDTETSQMACLAEFRGASRG